MLKRYDETQQSWVDTNSIKRYDTTQQAWIDVNSAKRYDTGQSSWEETAYQFMHLDGYGAYNDSVCRTVEDGLGVYVSFKCTAATNDNEPWFQFTIDTLKVPAGSTVKFSFEGSAIRCGLYIYSGTSSLYNNSNILQGQDFEAVVPDYDGSDITKLTIGINPMPTSGWDSTCSGYVRNVEIGGVKLKFPDVSINA